MAIETWTCSHCLRVNTRQNMTGRVAEEYVCSLCGNAGLGAITTGSFAPDNGTAATTEERVDEAAAPFSVSRPLVS
jgi:hypothetical protein